VSDRPGGGSTFLRRWAALCLVALTASCAYPTRNQEAASLSPRNGYRWAKLQPGELADTLIIVTASGGGTRASALALSVLRGLQQAQLPSGQNLADEVGVISSVSGGSVTAGYFALTGTSGFAALEANFIRKDGMAALLAAGLNPIGLAALATPSTERIDLLIDYLDRQLFGKVTFQALVERGKRPYLILNAADMVEEIPFPLTQPTMDLLCSDLTTMKLSTAVAASAAFPVALSPVTLTNYSHCPAEDHIRWPPQWASNAAATSFYDNPARLARGRVALAYASGRDGPQGKAYIHLLDGGIADNLGVSEPFRLLTTADVDPAFLTDITQGRIRRLVFVMVNARSFAASSLDKQHATPGALSMLMGTIDTSLDRATLGAANQLRTLLDSQFALQAKIEQDLGQTQLAANLTAISANSYFIPVDFDAIENPACRDAFHNIPTSWSLSSQQVDALMKVGEALLAQAPSFVPAMQSVGAHLAASLPTVKEACATLGVATQ
jgi:NTE family protein